MTACRCDRGALPVYTVSDHVMVVYAHAHTMRHLQLGAYVDEALACCGCRYTACVRSAGACHEIRFECHDDTLLWLTTDMSYVLHHVIDQSRIEITGMTAVHHVAPVLK